MNAGSLVPKNDPTENYLKTIECDSNYEDTLTSLATIDSENDSEKR